MRNWKLKLNLSFIREIDEPTDEDAIILGKRVAQILKVYKDKILDLDVDREELNTLINDFEFSLLDIDDFDNFLNTLYEIGDACDIWIETFK